MSRDGFAIPPAEYLNFVSGDSSEEAFFRAGREVSDALRTFDIKLEDARFLDVGSGCGRIARFLTSANLRSYRGFDRNHGMIEWCQRNITPKAPNFEFLSVDVDSPYSEWDGDNGTITAANFTFPYPDRSFDSALLASVFTHMHFAEIEGYLRELERVIDIGGKILASVFIAGGTADQWFLNFAYTDTQFREAFDRARLKVVSHQPGEHSWYVLSKCD